MRYLVLRRPMLLLPAVIAAMVLPVAPALAGEEDDSATLHASSQDCVNGHRAKAAVTSDDDIDASRSISTASSSEGEPVDRRGPLPVVHALLEPERRRPSRPRDGQLRVRRHPDAALPDHAFATGCGAIHGLRHRALAPAALAAIVDRGGRAGGCPGAAAGRHRAL